MQRLGIVDCGREPLPIAPGIFPSGKSKLRFAPEKPINVKVSKRPRTEFQDHRNIAARKVGNVEEILQEDTPFLVSTQSMICHLWWHYVRGAPGFAGVLRSLNNEPSERELTKAKRETYPLKWHETIRDRNGGRQCV